MKNLRKLLVLVLVFAMVLSISAISAAAAFTDTKDTKYGEAIDVLSSIGVINGTSSTTFDPTASLTREQAAKIITYMMLGSTNAALIGGVSSQKFSDVPTTRWSAGYIEYAATQGIIGGAGDGTFNPEGKLTVVAFTKMLLCALGYKADVEGLTGSSWAINTASLATAAGLYDVTIPISANVCTREQAAQLAFITLKSNLVQYSGGTVITIGSTTINTGSARSNVTNTIGTNALQYNSVDDGIVQFCESHFRDLRLTSTFPEAFGRPAHSWANGSTFIGVYKDTPVLTYNGSKLASTVATDLSGYTLPKVGSTTFYAIDNSVAVSYTGETGLVVSNPGGSTSTISPSTQTTASQLAGLTGNGKLVEFYADYQKHITKIVTVTYTVSSITNIVTTSDKTSYSIAGLGTTYYDYASPVTTDTIRGQAGMAIGDTITYVVAGSTVYVYPTTKVTGAATAYTTAYGQPSTLTVNGTAYNIGNAVTSVGSFGINGVPANYYIDQFGYVVTSSATAASTNYVYLVNRYGELKTDVNGTTPSAQIKVVKTDGTVAAYTLALRTITTAGGTATFNGGSITLAPGDVVISGTSLCVYDVSAAGTNSDSTVMWALNALDAVNAYTLDSAGTTITLSPLTDAAHNGMTAGSVYYDAAVNNLGYGVTFSASTAGGETALVNAATVYVIYNSTTHIATTYTGNYGLPHTSSAADLDGTFVVMTASGVPGTTTNDVGTASYVFTTVTGAGLGVAVAPTFVYINSSSYSEGLNASGAKVYTYSGLKPDGTTLSVTSTGVKLTNSGVYVPKADNSATDSDCMNAYGDSGIKNTFYVFDTLATSGSLVLANGAYYNITSDTKIVYVNPTLATVNGNKGFVVLAADSTGTTATNNVAAIYVVI